MSGGTPETCRKEIRRAALNLLARREQSRSELRARLLKRFPDVSDMVDDELARLSVEGLQSDERTAESILRYRAGRGQGPLKIRSALKDKGICEDLIAATFSACDVDWHQLIRHVASRRFGEEPPADARERARRGRFLQQRGFSFEQIAELYPF